MGRTKKRDLTVVSLRFNEKEQALLEQHLVAGEKASTQLKKLLFKQLEKATKRGAKLDETTTRKFEASMQENAEKTTGLLGLVVARMEAMDETLIGVSKDALRAKLVIENVQDIVFDMAKDVREELTKPKGS